MIWARMLAYISGTVDQELLLRNEYVAAENRILRAQIKGRLLLSDAERATLARSPTGWDAKPLKIGRRSHSQQHCWPGTENSLPRNSMDRGIGNLAGGPESTKNPSSGWCVWRRKIRAGAMTGSWGPWPTWVSSYRIKPWRIFSAAMIFRQLPSGSRQRVGKTLSVLTWQYWRQPTSSRWKC